MSPTRKTLVGAVIALIHEEGATATCDALRYLADEIEAGRVEKMNHEENTSDNRRVALSGKARGVGRGRV